MLRTFLSGTLLLCTCAVSVFAAEDFAFEAAGLRAILGSAGTLRSIYDRTQKREYLAPGQPAPLLTLVLPDKTLAPVSSTFDPGSRRIKLTYGAEGISATVKVALAPTHLCFELEAVQGASPVRIQWGPFPTTIGRSIGETVGIVRDEQFALGIQALNIQTVGLAAARPFGSVLEAYAIEHDGGVKGSKIALFGCPEKEALATIGQIEVAEGLPHPMLDGVWGKVSPTAKLSYMISSFGENDIDEVCRYAGQAGLKYAYHPGPFETWGHFKLNPREFPDGDQSMKRCVEKAAGHGIRLGVHTLTGFITPNDPYVTPVPDPRLARSGSSTLSAAVDQKATEIPVREAESFKKPVPWNKPMNTVIIGQELVQFKSVSPQEPSRLLGCTRGAFGTKAAAHPAGADVGHLADHAYHTFYPGIENGMMDEMTSRLVQLGNNTGLRQISFDGLEGLSAYGYGEYARNRFVKQCYDGWKGEVVSDASNLLHYLWHVHTRMNWGEPWGKAMREGMAEYRFRNQAYFERNLFPRMLGWFQLLTAGGDLEATTLDDMEWVLAKAAGYDAGFAVVTGPGILKAHGQAADLLRAVKDWESLRLAGAFSEKQREALRQCEFHLEAPPGGKPQLRPVVFSPSLFCPAAAEGPAQATWEIENQFGRQPLRLVLYVLPASEAAVDARLKDPVVELGGQRVTFPVELKPKQYLVCRAGRTAVVYDANWNELARVQADADVPNLPPGKHAVRFRCRWKGAPGAKVRAKFETRGEPEPVGPAVQRP